MILDSIISNVRASFGGSIRSFARMTGRAGKLQHFRYGVSKVRGRWYYRYHKPIGRANWKGYQERYLKPKDVEAKQRLVFAPKATSKQQKQAISWQWRLPKLLAQATTPNQVLDAWILFRYRQPKRLSHFMMTLRRLVEVGGCDKTDWRLQVLLSRMRKSYKRVISVDVLLRYFSQLKLYKEMERITRFLKTEIPLMKPPQLVSLLDSFAACRLRDTHVAGICSRYIRRNLSELATGDLIRIIASLGAMEIRSSNFIHEILNELLKRELSLIQFQDLLVATSEARIRDYTLIEVVSRKCFHELEHGEASEIVINILRELYRMGVSDPKLIDACISKISPFDIPLNSVIKLVRIGAPREDIKEHFDLIADSVCLIKQPGDLVDVLVAADKSMHIADGEASLLNLLGERLVALPRDTDRYDVVTVCETFARNQIYDEKLWAVLVEDLRFAIEDFEPTDFLRISKVFNSFPKDLISSRMRPLANDLAEWSLKRWEEFTPTEWNENLRLLTTDDHFTCNQWCRDSLTKWGETLTKSQKAHVNRFFRPNSKCV